MLKTIRTAVMMTIHYMGNSGVRKKYSLEGKELDPITKKQYRTKVYKPLRDLSNKFLKYAGAELEVKGKENLPKEGPVVYIVTHKGLYDPPILASIIEEPIIFIGKKETKKLPIISGWFDAMGCIYIDREDIKQSLQAILEGIKELKNGQSIVIFPEGTRSKKQDMAAFKAGSFKLATKANVPIVPIAIQDSYKLLEEKGRVSKAKVYVNIGKPIDVASLSIEEKRVLSKEVEGYVRELLEEVTF